MKKATKNKIIGISLTITGSLSLLFGVAVFFIIQDEKAESVTAIATVIDYKIHRSAGETEYQTILEYTNHKGQTIQFTDELRNYEPRFEIQEKVEIIYVPHKKNTEKINTLFSIYFLPMILFFFGIGSLLFGVKTFQGKVDFAKRKTNNT